MRCLLTFLLAVALVCPVMGQVAGAEYFVDTDPRYGAGTSITVPTGNDISKDFTLALASVAPGFHIIGVRAKDAQGHWSHTYVHSFYVISGTASTINASEYYIDTDPGNGNATAIPVTIGSDSALNYVVPLSAYSTGFHTIGIRSKDNRGGWSLTLQHAFYINENNATVNINSLQYQFTGVGATDSIYTYNIPVPAPSVDLNFTANLSQLVGEREYTMHIWAVNANGVRSEVLIKKLKVCSGEPAKARFEFAQAGNQVSFVNNSVGGTQYFWNFGDGQTDTILNPLHTYTIVGNYNVKLIAASLCNSDTITKVVSVAGLKEIITDHGGNAGSVTVNVYGAGFVPGTQLYLHRNGQTAIYGDTLLIRNVGLMSTTFNLAGKPVGVWDVITVFPNGTRDTLQNGFTIEAATEPKLWVNITGPSALRIGFNQIYTVTCGNSSNVDAVFVPVIVAGLPKGTNIKILNPFFNIESIPGFDTLHISAYNIRETFYDSISNTNFRGGYLSNMPAGSTQTIECVFEVPDTTPLNTYPKISVMLGKPFSQSTQSSSSGGTVIPDAYECLEKISELKEEQLIKLALSFDPTGISSCYNSSRQVTKKIYESYVSLKENTGLIPIFLKSSDLDVALFDVTKDCLKASTTIATAILGPEFLPALVNLEEEEKLAEMVGKATDLSTLLLIDCAPLLKGIAVNYIFPVIRNAFDPNEKYGIGDASNNHYTTSNPSSYTINYENDPAANINAQTVTVIDTLDISKYQPSSFGFTSVTIGDSIYSLPSPAKSFVHDFNFTSLYGVKARVTGTFDTTTGIAQWKFLSIDPVTNQATTNALAGFLPPDVISPKGQGYVSFKVNPKANIQNGDSVQNKAYIKFDYNPVIITNTWLNVFDLIKPTSHVQPMPSEVYDTTFTVQWNGTDNASGVRNYDIYYKVNNGAYQPWQYDISLPQSSFIGQKDSTYSFFSIAKDNAGNIESLKTAAERVVTIRNYDSSNNTCSGTSTVFSATTAGTGFTYQWQVKQDSVFTDITNNSVYSGATTVQLTLTPPNTNYSKYQYRCRISNGIVTYYSSLHSLKLVSTWLGTAGTAWETPANWSCGIVPDENTHVIIPNAVPHNPVVNVNGACKSLTMNSASNILIKTGVNLTITGKLNN